MKHSLILAGAALAFAAAPLAAKPAHAGGGHGKKGKHSQQVYGGQYGYQQVGYGYAQRGCPPGLAKKNNGCLPPGKAKKLAIGQRYQQNYGYDPYAYNQIPYDLRQRYGLDPYNRYYYDQGTLYGIDPRTMLVEQVIRSILR